MQSRTLPDGVFPPQNEKHKLQFIRDAEDITPAMMKALLVEVQADLFTPSGRTDPKQLAGLFCDRYPQCFSETGLYAFPTRQDPKRTDRLLPPMLTVESRVVLQERERVDIHHLRSMGFMETTVYPERRTAVLNTSLANGMRLHFSLDLPTDANPGTIATRASQMQREHPQRPFFDLLKEARNEYSEPVCYPIRTSNPTGEAALPVKSRLECYGDTLNISVLQALYLSQQSAQAFMADYLQGRQQPSKETDVGYVGVVPIHETTFNARNAAIQRYMMMGRRT